MELINKHLEKFLSELFKATDNHVNDEDNDTEEVRAQSGIEREQTSTSVVKTSGLSKLGLSGTPSRALRSQFDDAVDAVSDSAAPEHATTEVVSSGAAFADFQDDCAAASTMEATEAASAPIARAAAAVVYTPARTPGRCKLGLSGTPSRVFHFAAATPCSDAFYTPASSFSPSTPYGGMDSPVQLSASRHFR